VCGTLRGLHFQNPKAQEKLVTVVRGRHISQLRRDQIKEARHGHGRSTSVPGRYPNPDAFVTGITSEQSPGGLAWFAVEGRRMRAIFGLLRTRHWLARSAMSSQFHSAAVTTARFPSDYTAPGADRLIISARSSTPGGRVKYVWLPYLLMAIAYLGVLWIEAATDARALKRRLFITIVTLFVPLAFFKYTDFIYRDVVGPLFFTTISSICRCRSASRS
jgi:hypothetical protein